ncbi:branched-chain amino acid ABC transporter permease [Candidatus Kaiserbacteria bacterium]|nr:branched-chain amino acid ABC transporter permease [Candidatus Kaiserbacteria bacterium]
MDIIPQLVVNSIIAGAIYSMVALGFNLIYGTTKFFNLAHGTVAAIGGYTVFYLSKSLDFPVLPSVIVGVLFAGCIGYLVDKSVFRALRKKKASGMVFLVASLGVMTALQALVAILFSSQFQTLSVGSAKVYQVFGGVITQVQAIILLCVLLIMAGLTLLLRFTRFGKAVRATSDEEEVAKIVGINTNKIIGRVFFLGSAIAGLSGILVGFDTGIEPAMGLSLLLKGVIASIIGGIGNVYGGVLGAFLLGFIENFGIWKISGEWKDAIAFGVLLIFLLFRPQGLIKK